ncbi:MAG: DUF445 domain-containing protein [Acidobacteriota bacterium]|nr:DUF445 domain-containing protein [Acidobacteriota bacterium]
MESLQEIIAAIEPVFKNLYVQIGLLIVFATVHGYIGAWLAVRMLFRPRHPFKVVGITLFPQGMIPRHRDRLAAAIGKAVGEELVSQETIMEELLGKDFLRKKIRGVVDSYTGELMSQSYPSLIEALPAKLRAPVLDAITSLQFKVSKHIEEVLKSEESIETIRGFVERRVDDFLSKRVSEVIDDEAFEKIVGFLEDRIRTAIASPAFAEKIKNFISRRVDDLANTQTPLGQMFTDDAVLLLKEKANEQIEPVIHHLTELAAAEKTRNQIGALIKQEVHGYYEQLPFFKKMFVSRENLISEVDDLVNESLPKRIEETLKGDFFADEARNFIDTSIDNALARPLPEIVGTIAPEHLERLKAQIAKSVFSLIQGEEMMHSVSAYLTDTFQKLRPHSLDAIMETLHTDSEEKLKNMLSKGILSILTRQETSQIINSVLAKQIENLLAAPIGRLSDNISEEKLLAASESFSDTIIAALREKLPDAIREFNIGNVVREKISKYPVEKLESLVMSVAKEHLRTIELFGALFGFVIGVVQAFLSYWAFAK